MAEATVDSAGRRERRLATRFGTERVDSGWAAGRAREIDALLTTLDIGHGDVVCASTLCRAWLYFDSAAVRDPALDRLAAGATLPEEFFVYFGADQPAGRSVLYVARQGTELQGWDPPEAE